MKRCRKCGEVKEVAEFARDARKRDGCFRICRECDRARYRAYYVTHRAQKAAYDARTRPVRLARYREWRRRAITIYGGSCTSCGATSDLEFRHVDENGGEHRRVEVLHQMLRRIAETGRVLPQWRLELLCASCHRGVHRPAA